MILPQQYFWSGNGTENDFFDEENWVNYSTNQEPNNDIFSPNSPIEYELYLTCEININQEVILGVEPYIKRKAIRHLDKGRIVIFCAYQFQHQQQDKQLL